MIKIVIDTNIFLSAILYGGMAKIIFNLVLENKIELYVSSDLKGEILRKLKDYGANEETIGNAKIFLNHKSISISPQVKITASRDPNDNFLLELAQTA